MILDEDGSVVTSIPVTTTQNAGEGLDDPKLPINGKGNLFRRTKELIIKNKKFKSKSLND